MTEQHLGVSRNGSRFFLHVDARQLLEIMAGNLKRRVTSAPCAPRCLSVRRPQCSQLLDAEVLGRQA